MIVQCEINTPGSNINEKPNSPISYALYGGYFCKEKFLLSCQNSFICYCKIVKFNIFELGIFSFNSYVYYLTRGFIASTRAFNLATRAFNLLTRGFNPLTRAFNLPTHAFSLATRAFSLLTRGFELITREFELVTRGFELVTRNS